MENQLKVSDLRGKPRGVAWHQRVRPMLGATVVLLTRIHVKALKLRAQIIAQVTCVQWLRKKFNGYYG
jgi:hypothetical protein